MCSREVGLPPLVVVAWSLSLYSLLGSLLLLFTGVIAKMEMMVRGCVVA